MPDDGRLLLTLRWTTTGLFVAAEEPKWLQGYIEAECCMTHHTFVMQNYIAWWNESEVLNIRVN